MASELYVETLKGLTSGANANKVIIPSGQTLEVTDGLRSADMPAGSVLQVVSFGDSTHRSWNGTNRANVIAVPGTLGDGSVFIERLYNTSKILIQYTIAVGQEDDSWNSFIVQYAPAGSNYSTIPLIGQSIGGITDTGCLANFGTSKQGARGQYDTESVSFTYLLDPNTTTNKVFVRLATSYGHDGRTTTNYLNRPHQTSDNNRFTGTSTVTLTEIAG